MIEKALIHTKWIIDYYPKKFFFLKLFIINHLDFESNLSAILLLLPI